MLPPRPDRRSLDGAAAGDQRLPPDDGSYNVAWLRPQRRSGFRVAASANDNPTYLDAA
jgi:hypothetical protein